MVRHVSQLGKTHVSPFSIPDSNTALAFATGRTLQCLTFFSFVRHVSQLGETHVSPFSIPDSNTAFAFATGRTLQCLTFFSFVRHVSQLGKTHVSPFSIPDSNTDFAFGTGRTLQPVHLACIPSRISLFCIDPDDFQEIVWNKWQICCWWFKSTSCLAPSQFCLGPICLTSPSTFLN